MFQTSNHGLFLKVGMLLLMASLSLATACDSASDGKSNSGGDGDSDSDGDGDTDGDGDGDGQYLIEAYMGGPLSLDGFSVYVGRINNSDPSAKDATITINGTSVVLRPLMSDDNDAVYYAAGVGYEPNKAFQVEVSLGGKTASCSFTAPEGTDVNFDPDTDITLAAGDPLNLTWVFSGGTPQQLHLTIYNETTTQVDEDLDPSTTTYTVPGSETADWGGSGATYVASVDLGEFAYPFTGSLAAVTSVTALVLPGAATSVIMAK